MITALLLLSALPSAVVDVKPDVQRVLVVNLAPFDVKPDVARVFDGSVAEVLARSDSLEVVTSEDVAQLLDVEAQKAALACSASSCYAQIAGQLGARHVVYGSAALVDDTYVVQLSLLDTEAGRAIARQSASGTSALAVADEVRRAAARLTRALLGDEDEAYDELLGVSRPAVEPPPEPPGPFPTLAVAGGVTAVAGAFFLGGGIWLAAVNDAPFRKAGDPLEDRLAAQRSGQLGVVGIVIGSAAVVTGVGLVTWQLTFE